jgi:hypothetical protein
MIQRYSSDFIIQMRENKIFRTTNDAAPVGYINSLTESVTINLSSIFSYFTIICYTYVTLKYTALTDK